MTIDTKKIYSTISQFQGEMTQAHFELISIYLYEGQNSKLRDLDCNLILTYLIFKSLKLLNEKKIPLMIKSEVELNLLQTAVSMKEPFKRTVSRLYELTSQNFN